MAQAKCEDILVEYFPGIDKEFSSYLAGNDHQMCFRLFVITACSSKHMSGNTGFIIGFLFVD
jgi:hypothetical protein